MFLLEFDMANMNTDLPNFPEKTLWKTFDEAWKVVLGFASKCGVTVNLEEVIFDLDNGVLFIPNFCEIIPITVSTTKKVTWYGKKWVPKEEK